jgi:hypothetical protein
MAMSMTVGMDEACLMAFPPPKCFSSAADHGQQARCISRDEVVAALLMA